MANVLLKKSSVPGNAPDSSDLAYGEVAINYADGRLYYKNSSNVIKNFIDSDLLSSNYIKSVFDDKSPSLGGNLEINSFSIVNSTYGSGSYIALQKYYTGDSAQQAVISSRQDVNIIIDANDGTPDGKFHIRANDSDINNATSIFYVEETGYVNITNTVNLNSSKIINLLDPVDSQDAATKSYVDNISGSNVSISDVNDAAIALAIALG
jgi:hypothetical protein